MALVRNDAIYVNWKTRRRLKWIAKAFNGYGAGERAPAVERDTILTADEIADQYLNRIIEAEHPEIVQLEKDLDEREKELIERLQSNG